MSYKFKYLVIPTYNIQKNQFEKTLFIIYIMHRYITKEYNTLYYKKHKNYTVFLIV